METIMYNNLFIHVGLPKTGTTFLQKNVFPYLDVNYIPEYTKFGNLDRRILTFAYQADKPILISDEYLYGRIISSQQKANNVTILKRLKRLYPNAKIIICFREKKSWLKSIYNQFRKHMSRNVLVKNFDDWYNNYFDDEALNFTNYKNLAKELFDEVLILHYEDLVKDPDNFVKNIADFIGVDMPNYDKSRVNPSWKEKHYNAVNFLGKLPLSRVTRHIIQYLFNKLVQ